MALASDAGYDLPSNCANCTPATRRQVGTQGPENARVLPAQPIADKTASPFSSTTAAKYWPLPTAQIEK